MTRTSIMLGIITLTLQTSVCTEHTHDLFAYREISVCKPKSIKELKTFIYQAQRTNKKIAIVGQNKSMGGQTTSNHDHYRISLCNLNKLKRLDLSKKIVTVEAGMTWEQLQKILNPHGLSIRAMQSYHNFSIGGSLSVNAHGQDINDAPLIKTVISCTLLCADGTLQEISRTTNPELFHLVVGGYGLFGIITEVTLSLTDDCNLKRHIREITTDQLAQYITSHIVGNKHIAFFSARFSVAPSGFLEHALAITYHKSSSHCETRTLKPFSEYSYIWSLPLLVASRFFDTLKEWRFFFEKSFLKTGTQTTRNRFLHVSLATLPQSKQYILQEYFIPYDHLAEFIKRMKQVIQADKVNLLNLSARHVPQDTESLLSYAPQECCALVAYFYIEDNKSSYQSCVQWTRKLIQHALDCNGTFYLPYHLIATDKQIMQAYPTIANFMSKKQIHDPQELFSNAFYEKYCHIMNM